MLRSWFCLSWLNQFSTEIERENNFFFSCLLLFPSSYLFNKVAELEHADNKGLYLLKYLLEKVNSTTSLSNAFGIENEECNSSGFYCQ